MRWIFISPHFDDAVLSCGGLIWELCQEGETAEIWTVCAGFPEAGPLSEFALSTHAIWGTGDGRETVALRRDEDRAAAAALGASVRHFSSPDCIYRTDRAGGFLYPKEVFELPHAADAGLPARIASELGVELAPEDRIICPMALGNHVDHVLSRAAMELLQRPLSYYADFPYLLRFPGQLRALSKGMSGDLHAISDRGLAAWQSSLAAYRSQLAQLFETESEMRRQVHEYWGRERGIRLWSPIESQLENMPET